MIPVSRMLKPIDSFTDSRFEGDFSSGRLGEGYMAAGVVLL